MVTIAEPVLIQSTIIRQLLLRVREQAAQNDTRYDRAEDELMLWQCLLAKDKLGDVGGQKMRLSSGEIWDGMALAML